MHVMITNNVFQKCAMKYIINARQLKIEHKMNVMKKGKYAYKFSGILTLNEKILL